MTKKHIYIELEMEYDEEIDGSDKCIIDDIKCVLNCCAHWFDIKAINIATEHIIDLQRIE